MATSSIWNITFVKKIFGFVKLISHFQWRKSVGKRNFGIRGKSRGREESDFNGSPHVCLILPLL